MATEAKAKLFTPLKAGALELGHRVVMAPLTRCRASPGYVPNELMVKYYQQRASLGTLIVSEAVPISEEGRGMQRTPGMYTTEQVEGWKPVVNAVHEKGGLIVAQLWHMGRVSHSSFQPGGKVPVSSSATPMKATSRVITATGEIVPYETPRALELSELPRVVADYRHAAECAKAAGFDGVEIHGANGYLLDQFFHDGVNKRTDEYGGSIENRARLAFEVLEAVIDVWGKERVGIRLSPPVFLEDTDKASLFSYIIKKLDTYDIAYLHLVNGYAYERFGIVVPEVDLRLDVAFFRPLYKGVMFDCGKLTREKAIDLVQSGVADAAAFGQWFISNPDLVERLEKDLPINEADSATYFTEGPVGYTDYPTYEEEMAEKAKGSAV